MLRLFYCLFSLKVFARADPLTKITMEIVSHTLGSLQVHRTHLICHTGQGAIAFAFVTVVNLAHCSRLILASLSES